MKKLLLLVTLIMVGGIIVVNSTEKINHQQSSVKTIMKGEVDWWFEDDLDFEDNVIGRALIVQNNTNKAVNVTFIIVENGQRDTISKYVPAREKRRAWYGNKTLRVEKAEFEDAY